MARLGAGIGALLALAALAALPYVWLEGPERPRTASVTKAAGDPVKLSWRARVAVAGAEFRIYRGPDVGHLQPIARMAAGRGEQGYRFRDDAATTGDAVYEVRFVDGQGREQLVARAFCARATALGKSAAPERSWSDHALLAPVTSIEIAAQPLAPPPPARQATQPGRRPLTPPPRALRS